MNELSTASSPPPEDLRRSLLARADELAMLPAVATEALEIAKDPDCTMSQFSCVVERDVKLATEILSLANSAIFSVGQPVADLQHAIVRLGFRQCRHLILSSSAASLMKRLPIEQEWIREILWQHNLVTATACVHINRALNLGFHGEEFSAGLIHDFGRLLFAVAAPEKFSEVDLLDFNESQENLDREYAILGVTHCDFGAWFAEYNGLPEELAAAIRWHHDVDHEHPHQKLAALTAAGDHIANHLQRCEESRGYVPEENAGIAKLSELTSVRLDEQFASVADTMMDLILRDMRGATNGCVNPSLSGVK